MPTIGDLFKVEYGNKFDMNKMARTDRRTGIAFIGRKGGLTGDSGVSGYVQPKPGVTPYPAGSLTVALGGSRLLSTYVQQRPFYTAQNVAVLTPFDSNMSLKARLYYAACIRHNAFRYTAFGREANRTLGTIELPPEAPDWVEASQIPTHEGLSKAAGPAVPIRFPSDGTWADFHLEDLFTIKKGKRVTQADRNPGSTRFIGASEKNNGITDYCDLAPTHPAGVMTVAYNGNSVGYAFYQAEPFFASDDVNVLYPKYPMNMWVQLFIASVIKHQRGRYTYGYKWTLARMRKTTVRLPVDSSGQPDWLYMDAFMQSLEFSSALT